MKGMILDMIRQVLNDKIGIKSDMMRYDTRCKLIEKVLQTQVIIAIS